MWLFYTNTTRRPPQKKYRCMDIRDVYIVQFQGHCLWFKLGPGNPTLWLLTLPGRKWYFIQPKIPREKISGWKRFKDWSINHLLPDTPYIGFGRHKATMPNGLERNPYRDTIMYFQVLKLERGKKSIFLRQGKIHNHWMSYHCLLQSAQIKFSAPLTSEMCFIYNISVGLDIFICFS